MLFNSYIFILIFLPLCLTGYHFLNSRRMYRAGMLFLLGMSLWFYGYFNPWYLLLICGSIIANYCVYRGMIRFNAFVKPIFISGLVINLGTLAFFKYTDFFIRNVNYLFSTDLPLLHILLPLGISFFTFQQISFLADSYRGIKGAGYSFLEYASFVAFFPQLVAGPIVTHDILIPQFSDEERKHIDWELMAKGLALFTFGLAKKVLLADAFGNVANLCFSGISFLNSPTAVIAMLSYTFQIYFDFSGYSDMAIGLGWMLGIDLPVNFDSPYKSRSISEFWKRWHITLTSFFTKYVYIPLGGNRKGKTRTCVNIFVVFFLSGLWHGAGWTFVLWGIMHGLAMIIEGALWEYLKRIPSLIRGILTFGFVNIAWIFFRAESIGDALAMIKCILHFRPGSIEGISVLYSPLMKKLGEFFSSRFELPVFFQTALFLGAGFIIVFFLPNAKHVAQKSINFRLSAVCLAALLTWCLFSFSGMTTFLYYNF